MRQKTVFPALFLLIAVLPLTAQRTAIYDSGGPLMTEQAGYDVTFYDLSVQLFPEERRLEGRLEVRAKVVHPMDWLVLDLDTTLAVSGATELLPGGQAQPLKVRRETGKVWIWLNHTRQHGESFRVQVSYGGNPRVAPRAPWDGGLTWAKTPSGAHWIATTCQGEGADVWWPVKDHVSDEPDSMALHVRVPEPLVAACNGRLLRTEQHADGTRTFHWYISTPINTYNVALNIAPYRVVEGQYRSVAGEDFPVVFYVLPEDYEKGRKLFQEILDHIRFYEKYLGPYPFRIDKYGVAQTMHLGMEHQSIIAYGARFNNGAMTGGRDWGFDALHHHEFGHEWWGNLVTNADWRDMWIHEGFCSYMQALYMEDREGKSRYHEYMNNMRRFPNNLAVAPRAIQSSKEIYRAPIYTKGAWILHALRFLIGDQDFLSALRRMAYPDPAMEKIKDGRQCRFVSTDDFLTICEQESGQDLDWFFDLYLRQPALPKLFSRIEGDQLTLRWETPGNLPFPMPVEVELNGKRQRLTPTPEGLIIRLTPGDKPVVDPDRWGLYEVGSRE